MKSFLMSAVAITCGAIAFAEVQAEKPSKLARPIYDKAMRERFGGYVEAPDSLKGVIGFFNAQSTVPESNIHVVVSNLSKRMKYNYKVSTVQPTAKLPTRQGVEANGAAVGVYLVDCEDFPALLVAPDERWGLVNVAKLKVGLKDDKVGKSVLSIRARGELLRAFALACGLGTSQYPDNIFNVTSTEDLDSTPSDVMIFDMFQRCSAHLKKLGVTPERKVLYAHAVKEGWAPQPTNDVQKAVWKKVHAPPEKPMKITYDKDKQKPVVK